MPQEVRLPPIRTAKQPTSRASSFVVGTEYLKLLFLPPPVPLIYGSGIFDSFIAVADLLWQKQKLKLVVIIHSDLVAYIPSL